MNKIFYIVLFSVLIFTSCEKSEESNPNTFIKYFGGVATETGYQVSETNDGYILIGSTESYGNGGKDMYVVKTDKKGNQKWFKTFGGPGDEEGRAVKVTPDGGYILLGDSIKRMDSIDLDMHLIKLSSMGMVEWKRVYGLNNANETGFAVENAPNGGYVLLGRIQRQNGDIDAVIVYTKNNGDEEVWSPKYRGGDINAQEMVGNSVVDAGDNFVFTMSTQQSQPTPLVVRYKYQEGSETGAFNYTNLGETTLLTGSDIKKIDPTTYVLTGKTTDNQIYVLKLQLTGLGVQKLLYKTYGGSGVEDVSSIVPLTEGGFALVGTTDSKGNGANDIYFLKLDADGNILSEKTFGGSSDDHGACVLQTSDNGFIISGTIGFGDNDKMMCLIKTDSNGNLEK